MSKRFMFHYQCSLINGDILVSEKGMQRSFQNISQVQNSSKPSNESRAFLQHNEVRYAIKLHGKPDNSQTFTISLSQDREKMLRT